jgi:hypothetical protein
MKATKKSGTPKREEHEDVRLETRKTRGLPMTNHNVSLATS